MAVAAAVKMVGEVVKGATVVAAVAAVAVAVPSRSAVQHPC